MKRSLKKLFTFCLCILMFATAVPCLAVDSNTENDLCVANTSEKVRVLNGNEAVSALMSRGGLSYQEALQEYSEILRSIDRLEERYVSVDAGMGYKVEVGCLVRVKCGGGRCGYSEIIETWSNATGNGKYTWEPFYKTATIFEDPSKRTDNIRFQTRGALVVAYEGSGSVGFEAAGFSFNGSLGSTTYYRKTVSINKCWLE